MNSQKRNRNALSMLIFSLGLILGVAFIVGATWGDLEAFVFDTTYSADAKINSLKCPILITRGELGVVSASFSNPTEKAVRRLVQAHITEGYVTLYREVETRLALEPGETQLVEFEVNPEDAAFNRFILVRLHTLRQSPFPSSTGACGIMVANIPFFTGNQIVAFVALASLAAMAVGMGLWMSQNREPQGRQRRTTYSMIGLAGVVLVGMFGSFLGYWVIGGASLLLSLILIVEVVTFHVMGAR